MRPRQDHPTFRKNGELWGIRGVAAFIFWVIGTSLALGGCLPASTPQPLPTDTPLPTETPTPTLTPVWFPPTATPTPFPTPEILPTEDLKIDLGDVILSDDFSTGENWQLGHLPAGNIALGKHELTIAIHEGHGYLSSLREQPELVDFYAVITATPTLCRGEDEYGLLFRASSESDFYRFSLSCDGRVRVDRVLSGTPSSPQPWAYSEAVPAGAPSISQLAIWARGKEMRFFVNDMYQFSVNDPSLPSGSLGVFARSAGDQAVTVNFSDLVIQEIR